MSKNIILTAKTGDQKKNAEAWLNNSSKLYKRLIVTLEDEQHKAFKSLCSANGKIMMDVAREWVLKAIKEGKV